MAVATKKTNITKAINELVYKMTSGTIEYQPSTAMDINDGLCDQFAGVIERQFEEAKALWGDELTKEFWETDDDDWITHHAPYHCFIVFRGKYYDSESPEGVDHPIDLFYYQRELENIKRYSR